VQHAITCLIFRESDMLTNLSFQYVTKILLLNNLKTHNLMLEIPNKVYTVYEN